MLGHRWFAALALLVAQTGSCSLSALVEPAPALNARGNASRTLCLRGGGEVATPIDDDEDDEELDDDGDEDDMEDDDGDDDGDDGDDGDDDDEEDEEAVEESANDLDTGALKRLMIMGTITVAMHLFLPKVPDAHRRRRRPLRRRRSPRPRRPRPLLKRRRPPNMWRRRRSRSTRRRPKARQQRKRPN